MLNSLNFVNVSVSCCDDAVLKAWLGLGTKANGIELEKNMSWFKNACCFFVKCVLFLSVLKLECWMLGDREGTP